MILDDVNKGILCGALFMANVWILTAMFRRRQRNQAELQEFVRGMNIGVRNHAIWINRQGGFQPVNGFALSCDKCGVTIAAIQPVEDEYHRCLACGHRNPAPLAPEMEVPHGH